MLLAFIFTSLSLTATTPTCLFIKEKPGYFELTINKSKTLVETAGPNAELLSCKEWPKFPHLVVAEIKMGSYGTTSEITRTNVFVFNTSKRELKEIFTHVIKTEVKSRNSMTGKITSDTEQETYSLETAKSSKPAVKIKNKLHILPLE